MTPAFRFSVIGFGRRGRYHMESLEAMEHAAVRCVAVADPRSILPGMVIPTAALESMAPSQRIDCAARLRQASAVEE